MTVGQRCAQPEGVDDTSAQPMFGIDRKGSVVVLRPGAAQPLRLSRWRVPVWLWLGIIAAVSVCLWAAVIVSAVQVKRVLGLPVPPAAAASLG